MSDQRLDPVAAGDDDLDEEDDEDSEDDQLDNDDEDWDDDDDEPETWQVARRSGAAR